MIACLRITIGRSNMSNVGKHFFKFNNYSENAEKLNVDYYTGAAEPVEVIRELLGKFDGGKIDLTLNNENGIARLVLNNPSRRNAITGNMMLELEKAVETLESWQFGKGVLLYGAEGNFCSGGDLEFAKKTGNAADGFKMASFMQNVLTRFETLPLITAAFINGTGALGGGAEIAVSCDYRLMRPNDNTPIAFVHSKMGIVPAWGGCGRLVKLTGIQNAMDILCTGRIIKGEEGMKLGLINGLVLSVGDAEKWLLEKTKADKSVLKTLKCCLLNSIYNKDNPQEVESRLFSPLWGGKANREALERNIKHRVSES